MRVKKVRRIAIFSIFVLVTACGSDVTISPVNTFPAAIATSTAFITTSGGATNIASVNITAPPVTTQVEASYPLPSLPPKTLALTPTLSNGLDISKRWLQGIPCKPSCFEGITPGKTTADEAVAILSAKPQMFTKVEKRITKSNTPFYIGNVHWEWVNPSERVNPQGSAVFPPPTASATA